MLRSGTEFEGKGLIMEQGLKFQYIFTYNICVPVMFGTCLNVFSCRVNQIIEAHCSLP